MVKTQQTGHIIWDSSDILCPPLNCFLRVGITEAKNGTLWIAGAVLFDAIRVLRQAISNLLMEGGHS